MNASGLAESPDGTGIAWSRSGTGPVLVMVDPVLADRALSPNGPLAAVLSDHLTVIRYDRRGKGKSIGGTPYAIDREVEDLAAVMAAGGSGSATSVYGFSSGGSLALYAASCGVSMASLVVVEPPSDLPGAGDFVRLADSLVRQGRNVEAVRRFYEFQGMPPEVVEQMAPLAQACAPYAGTIRYDLGFADALTSDVLAGVAVPTLAIGSAASPTQLRRFVQRVAEHVADCESMTLAGDWHGVATEALASVVTGFVASAPGR